MPPEDSYDAVIAGGGIQGLTLAAEGAARGLRVLLLEAGAFGAGSTAASYGIVHGGFRYWQDLDVVRLLRSRIEQAWFLRSFPGLVAPLRCVLPFYAGDRTKPKLFAVAAAMDRLGSALARRAAPELPEPRLIGRAELLAMAPWLQGQEVHGAGCWHDAEILDPPALVEALVARARRAGAICLAGHAVQRVVLAADGGIGRVVARTADGQVREFAAPVLVNCAGAGLDQVARLAHPQAATFFRPLKAWNLRLSPAHRAALPAAFAVGSAKRLFVRPAATGIFAGTFYGERDIPAWLAALDEAAPGLGLGSARVESVSEGVVPEGTLKGHLPEGTLKGHLPEGTLKGHLPQGALNDLQVPEPAHRDVIVDHAQAGGPRGLYSVSGVKLTTARWLSRRAIARIWPALRPKPSPLPAQLAGARA